MYSASVVDSTTMSSFLDPHTIALDPSRNTIPEVLLQSLIEPPQTLFVNPSRTLFEFCENHNPYLVVPANYLIMRLAAHMCFLGV